LLQLLLSFLQRCLFLFPGGFVLALGLIVDFLGSYSQQVSGRTTHAGHLPGALWTITIIVLGEAVIAVVEGAARNGILVRSLPFGLGIAFSLWWIYFDNVGGAPVRNVRADGRVSLINTWLYTHLPLVIALLLLELG